MSGWHLSWTSERSIWAMMPDSIIDSRKSSQLAAWISTKQLDSIRTAVPSSRGVLFEFHTQQVKLVDPWSTVLQMIEAFELESVKSRSEGTSESRKIRIPVCYNEVLAPDLNYVAEQLNFHPEHIIELHTAVEYKVDSMGFMPGFGYLSALNESLRLSRKVIPRTRVPAGSVAIAESMTAVYPHQSAGGWHLIGRTPKRLFNPNHNEPAELRVGDSVLFEQITLEDFKHYSKTQRWGES